MSWSRYRGWFASRRVAKISDGPSRRVVTNARAETAVSTQKLGNLASLSCLNGKPFQSGSVEIW